MKLNTEQQDAVLQHAAEIGRHLTLLQLIFDPCGDYLATAVGQLRTHLREFEELLQHTTLDPTLTPSEPAVPDPPAGAQPRSGP